MIFKRALKPIPTALLCLCLGLSLTACGSSEKKDNPPADNNGQDNKSDNKSDNKADGDKTSKDSQSEDKNTDSKTDSSGGSEDLKKDLPSSDEAENSGADSEADAREQAAKTAPVKTAPPAESAAMELPSKTLKWVQDKGMTAALEDRFAVLIGADKYQEKSWDVPFAKRNLAAMQNALSKYSGFPASSIAQLSGDSVNLSAIQASILNVGRRVQAKKALFVFYFTGHGYVAKDGTPYYFTHYTRETSSGGQYDDVLSRTELAQWIARARTEAQAKGVTLDIITVMDACRTSTLAPPPRAVLRGAQNWEIYGTKAGRFAQAPSESKPSPFTRALVESLEKLSGLGKEASITRVFQDTMQRTKELTNGSQEPEFKRGSQGIAEPNLVVPNQVTVGVRVLDSLTGTVIQDASLKLDNRPPTKGSKTFKVQTRAGPHIFEARATDYLIRSQEVAVDVDKSGQILEMHVLPAIIYVRGRISPPGTYEVRAQGIPQSPRQGYHQMRVLTTDSGVFELRLPGLAQGAQLVIARGSGVAKRLVLPSKPYHSIQDKSGVFRGVGLVELERISLDKEGSKVPSKILALEKALENRKSLLPMPKEFQRPSSTASPFKDAGNTNRWNEAMKWVKDGKMSVARSRFAVLKKQTAHPDVEAWLNWLEVASAEEMTTTDPIVKRMNSVQRSRPRLATALGIVLASKALERSKELAKSGNASALSSFRLITQWLETAKNTPAYDEATKLQMAIAATLVRRLAERRDWEGVLRLFEDMEGSAVARRREWIDIGREILPVALKALLTTGLKQGQSQGDWNLADRAINFARGPATRVWGLSDSGLQDMLTQVERERLPKSTRNQYEAARAALSAGQLEQAYSSYLEARRTANTYYTGIIDNQLKYLQTQLSNRYLNQGGEFEAKGQIDKAADSYLKARSYDFRAKDYFYQLLETHPPRSNTKLSQLLSVYQQKYSTEDTRLAVLKNSKKPEDWQRYLKDFPAGSARPLAYSKIRELKGQAALSEARRKNTMSAWQNYLKVLWPSERPSVVVAKKGGDFTSIQEAVDKVPDGTRVMIEEGVYKEHVVLTRPVELRGKGKRDKIIIEFKGKPSLVTRSPYAVVQGLTFKNEGGGRYATVDIGKGWFVMEDCDLSAKTLAAASLHGSVYAYLRRCNFKDCPVIGLMAYEKGRGSIENCVFTNSQVVGIAVLSKANPTVKLCQFKGGGGGVASYAGGLGTFKDCVFVGNTNAAMAVRKSGLAKFIQCRVVKSLSGGLLVDGSGEAVLEGCEITGSALAGIEVSTRGEVRGNNCLIKEGNGVGVLVRNGGVVTLRKSSVYKNLGSGFEARNGAKVTFEDGKILGNQGLGAWSHERSRITISNSTILGNAKGAGKASPDSIFTSKNNKTS